MHSKSEIFKTKHLLSLLVAPVEPKPISFTQASKYSHRKHAIDEKYNALMANGTLDLVPP